MRSALGYFSRFSRVAVEYSVSQTLGLAYSKVRMKELGSPSQGTTWPSASRLFRNSWVRREVEVLSRSKIPMMLFSRTAISLPIERYTIPFLSVGEGLDPPGHPKDDMTRWVIPPYKNNPYPISWDLYQYSSIFSRNPSDSESHDREKIFARQLRPVLFHVSSV